ncbi:MAG: HEPN domain-containing protein [Armatimonadetes bacterium]|nr:HEPN domain-containing protein [Armatimonadota bacterium]
MTEANKRLNISQAVAKGERDLESARALLGSSHFDNSVVLAYYGAFHHARAILLREEIQTKTHEGLIRMLSLHFVQPGRLAPEWARVLSVLEAERLRATYDSAAVFNQSMATESIEQACAFAAQARSLLEQAGYLSGE